MQQNEQHFITVGHFTASILFDAGRFDLCIGRMERGAFIGHRSMGARKTFAGAEKAARRALARLDSGDKAQ